MDAARLTYRKLFALLASLGFKEQRPVRPSPREPRMFVHDATETVLLFRNANDESLSEADLLSAEVHLHANNLVEGPLESLLGAMPASK